MNDKTKWSKVEILEMGVSTISTVIKAMEQGYFSKSILNKNKLEIENTDVVYAYSGGAKAYVKLYKSNEAFELFKDKKLRY